MQDHDSEPISLAAIVNNIPSLAQALGLNPVLAAVLSASAVALSLVTDWEAS